MSKLVLIVEDEEVISSILDTALKNAGYRTMVACSGVEAKQILEKTKPDLMTLDIYMPEMTGIELLEDMKSTQYLDGVKIILVSGLPVDDLMVALVSGADWVFEKPINHDDLIAKVAELIGDP